MDGVEYTTPQQPKLKGGITGKGWLPGQSGNPAGRPKGSVSIRDKIRQYLEDHPGEVDRIVKHFVKENMEFMWQMLEGKPHQTVDTSMEITTVTPLLEALKAKPQEPKQEGDAVD